MNIPAIIEKRTGLTPNDGDSYREVFGAVTDALVQGGPAALELVAATAESLDATRYRFLRNIAMKMDDAPSVVSGASGEFDFLQGSEVDDAVDEAMEEWKRRELTK